MRELVYHDFLDCEKSVQLNFKLYISVPDTMLNQMCYGRINFLPVMDLIFNFEDTSVYRASIIKGLLTRFNNFSSSSKTSNAKTSVQERFNTFGSIF